MPSTRFLVRSIYIGSSILDVLYLLLFLLLRLEYYFANTDKQIKSWLSLIFFTELFFCLSCSLFTCLISLPTQMFKFSNIPLLSYSVSRFSTSFTSRFSQAVYFIFLTFLLSLLFIIINLNVLNPVLPFALNFPQQTFVD